MFQAYGLYTHIRANRIRSAFLLGGLFLLVYVMTFAGALAGEAMSRNASLGTLIHLASRDMLGAVPLVTIATGLWVFLAWRFHQTLIDLVTGARPVTRAEQPRLYNLLENLCISRGIPMPRLEVMDSDVLNAFASGLNPKQYSITVTSGLLNALDDQEMEAVLAHELTHIRNEDVRLMVIAVVIAGALSFFGEMIFRVLTNVSLFSGRSRSSSDRESDGKGGGAFVAILISIALVAVSWALSVVIRFALSRSREFLADAGAVELTKNPDAMIAALRRIDGKGEIPRVPSGIMEMCIDNPRSGFADLFATHPSIDARVAALVRYGGGHDLPLVERTAPSPDALAPPASPDPTHPWGAPPAATPGPGDPWAAPPATSPADPWGSPPAGPWGPRAG